MYNYRGPFGMSSGQSQEYKGLVFNLFLKYVLRFIQTWSDLFLPEQFEVWELNGRWIWGLKLQRDWLFCGDVARFLRTGRMTVVWLQQQALRWEAAGLRLWLKERQTWTSSKNLLWRWRLQDFDNFSGQAKYVFILRIVQTVVLKNCRTCAAIACYVRKLDHWLQEERRYLIMRS